MFLKERVIILQNEVDDLRRELNFRYDTHMGTIDRLRALEEYLGIESYTPDCNIKYRKKQSNE